MKRMKITNCFSSRKHSNEKAKVATEKGIGCKDFIFSILTFKCLINEGAKSTKVLLLCYYGSIRFDYIERKKQSHTELIGFTIV